MYVDIYILVFCFIIFLAMVFPLKLALAWHEPIIFLLIFLILLGDHYEQEIVYKVCILS